MTDLAEIFRIHGPAYREKYGSRMPESHRRAMDAIQRCRTESLGGQVYSCADCKEHRFSYHSCKNRHCPKCQNEKASDWLENQKALLLPVLHFLVTFTIPEELRSFVRSHEKTLLHLLFQSSAAALRNLCHDPRFLGGDIGILGVLHTWTRALVFHPHIHYVVPGVALRGESWVVPKQQNFLVPVKALSVLFRAKFRDAVLKADPALFSSIPKHVWKKKWVVHSKPVGNGEHALEYLAPYVFRVALSNNRILSLRDGMVTFEYKDSETKERKLCVLPAEEFIRRFLQHVLPKGFIKVRYYGLFAPRVRDRLEKAKALLGGMSAGRSLKQPPVTRHPPTCPKCGKTMSLLGRIERKPP